MLLNGTRTTSATSQPACLRDTHSYIHPFTTSIKNPSDSEYPTCFLFLCFFYINFWLLSFLALSLRVEKVDAYKLQIVRTSIFLIVEPTTIIVVQRSKDLILCRLLVKQKDISVWTSAARRSGSIIG